MEIAINRFNGDQRKLAIQRLTAVWAFTESGLGGMLHALQIPVTGLVIGGMSIVLITLIAFFSKKEYKYIFQSLLVVLIIKAAVSPYTPVAAYFAVSFQALLAYLLFRLAGVNLLTILLLSVITMLESALQKILIIWLFFGASFRKALDELLRLVTKMFGQETANGSYWLAALYLFVYFIGGLFFAWLTYKIVKDIFEQRPAPVAVFSNNDETDGGSHRHSNKKIQLLLLVMLVISALLYWFADDKQQGWLAVAKTISWTSAAILLWYLVISPVFTRLIRQFLKRREGRYNQEIARAMAFLPVSRKLAAMAWQQSGSYKGWRRIRYFSSTFVQWALTCSEDGTSFN